ESPGWWNGIFVREAGSATLEHTEIAYAGKSTWLDSAYRTSALYKSGSGALTLKNSTIHNSSGNALEVYAGYQAFISENNRFEHSNRGVFIRRNVSFNDNTSRFSGNILQDAWLEGGTLDQNVTWNLSPDYSFFVSGNVTVAADARLQVMPGTVLKFAQSQQLVVNGELDARGTADAPIHFTDWRDDIVGGDANRDEQETEPAPGWWPGIFVGGVGSATLEYIQIAYAGRSNWFDSAYRSSGLYKSGSGDLTLKHSNIHDSGGEGLQVNASSGTTTLENSAFTVNGKSGLRLSYSGTVTAGGNTFSNNQEYGILQEVNDTLRYADNAFSGNTLAGVGIHGGTRTADMTLAVAGSPYRIIGSITVDEEATLAIEPGVRVEFSQSRQLVVNGVLTAVGTAAAPIVFTGTEESPGWWNGIFVREAGSATLEHTEIAYAGKSTWLDSAYRTSGLYKSGSGALTLKNSFIRFSSNHGLDLSSSTGTTLVGNSFFSGNAGSGLRVHASQLTVAGSTFSNNEGYGLQPEPFNHLIDYASCVFSGNALGPVGVKGGQIASNSTWALAGSPYRITDSITVDEEAILTIEPGVRVEFSQSQQLVVNGGLTAVGTTAAPIVFTGTEESPGWWNGIFVREAGSATLEHTEIAYAGKSTWLDSAYRTSALYKSGSGALTLKNSTIHNSSGNALEVYAGYQAFISENNRFEHSNRGVFIRRNVSFNDNTSRFSGNILQDAWLEGGTLDQNVTWNLSPDYSFFVSGNVTVAADARLQVMPGTVLKFAQSQQLVVNGELDARGTADAPIHFTDWRDDIVGGDANRDEQETEPAPGWWPGIFVGGVGSATLEYIQIAYAGRSNWFDSAYRSSGLYKSGSGDLTLKNSNIRDSSGAGLLLNNSTGDHEIIRNTFAAISTGVLVLNQPTTVVLDRNLVEGNTDFGVRNQNSAEVDARNNWWGHETGPYHAERNPDGQGDTVSDGVLFEPWRTSPSSGEIISPTRSGTIAAGDSLRFRGSALENPAAGYRWEFGDGRSADVRHPGVVRFPAAGEYQVRYAAVVDGQVDAYPDTRTYAVVPDPGNLPDLRVANVGVSGTLAVGQPAQVTYTVRNAGQGPAGPGWRDAVYLSADPYLDTEDIFMGSAMVDQVLDPGQSYQQTMTAVMPAVAEGAYYLIVAANDEWQVLELHRLNNEHGVQVAAQVPALEQGVSRNVSHGKGLVEQYFRMTATAGQNLVLDLTRVPSGLEVFIGFGSLPTRGAHDFRLRGGERFVIPAAAAGNWYALVHGRMEEFGSYDILFDMVDVALTRISPTRHGTLSDLVLTLTGAGFIGPLDVELISATGQPYGGDEVEADAFTQATATFAAGVVPAGIYAVRITRNGQTALLPSAVEIIDGGEPRLETNLILPANIGYNTLATIYVEYANTGDASMPAPLLMLAGVQHDRQGAILTLEHHKLSRGFWARGMPQGFSSSVQFLASGATPGVLQPGESGRVPVYYTGWTHPWDTSGGRPPIDWELSALTADDTTPADWAALKDEMRPDYVQEDAWNVLWNNFTSQAGTTWGDYIAMLSRNAVYLHRQGARVEDVQSLLAFSMRLADGLSPLPVLAGGADAAVQGPGLPIVFERVFLQPISRRFVLGDMGRGWTHNWRQSLTVREDETVVISDLTGTPRIFNPDSRYAGRYLAQPGDEGVLRAVDGGFRLTEQSGGVQFYRDGKLEYVEDTNGNRITCTYAGDQLTRLSHSAGGRLDFTYTPAGYIASVTDHHGRRTGYSYTGEHLTSVQAYDGRTITYTYDTAAGPRRHALTTIVLPDGVRLTYDYDGRGRLSAVWRDDQQEKVSITHGDTGRIVVTDALGNPNRVFFDHWARVVRAENALGEAVRMDFDELGNLTSVTDPDGMTATLAYDRRGNLVEITDVMHRSTRFSYTRAFNQLATVTDALGRQTAHSYDNRGNLTAMTYPDGSREQWSYDGQGNPIAWTNRRGAAMALEYDAAGRVTRKHPADGSWADYRYDARGNLVEAEDEQGVTRFTYDDHDYLIRIDYPHDRHLIFMYDAFGRRISSTDQLNHVLNYHYDEAGRLNRLSEEGVDVVVYAYDQLGRMARKTMGNGVYTTYAHDPAGRLLALENHKPDGEILSRFAYTYDRRGRRTAMETHYGTWTYGYDDSGQLVRAVLVSTDPDVPSQDLTYEYDALGNRIRTLINGQEETYDANNLNQYTTVGDRTYTYDLDGNLIREAGPDGITVYTYNNENRLVGVTRGGETWEYTYDALGNRVAVDENGAVTHYVYDPVGLGDMVGEYNNAGNLIARYTHGFGLVSRTAPSVGSSYYTFDPMGNTSELTGAGSVKQNRYAYQPFGSSLHDAASEPNPFKFMGQFGVVVDKTGLHYVRARQYDSVLGRFVASDPIGFGGGDINWYRYGYNNPNSFLDPNGEEVVTTGLILTGLLVLGVTDIVLRFRDAGENHKKNAANARRKSDNFIKDVIFMETYGEDTATRHGRNPYGHTQQQLRNNVNTLRTGGEIVRDGVITVIPVVGDAKTVYDEARGRGVFGRVWRWLRGPQACTTGSQTGNRNNEIGNLMHSLSYAPQTQLHDCIPGYTLSFGSTRVIASWDPNEKTTVAGFGDGNHVRGGSQLSYRIDFENYASATAPAQIVTIRDVLSEHLDLGTLELAEIGFGEVMINVPPGLQYFETVVDYAYTDDEYDFEIEVHVDARLENGTLFFNFFTYDPDTGLPPADASIGFLMPETEPATGRGQGYVTYLIRPKADLPSGTAIRNIATIQFDYSLEIDTNQVDPLDPDKGTDPAKEALVTFDGLAPTSRVSALPAVTATETFTVSWSGEDDEHGSGVGAYDIHVRENSGAWTRWLEGTAATSALFTGRDGQSYAFHSVATDNVGNREVKAAQAEASTRVDVPPTSHTVTFRDHDGTLLKTMQVNHGGRAVPPAEPVREGHIFIGWNADLENITSDLTVTARYAAVPEGLSDREWLTSFYVA
ncbi:MAG: hypothetical protein EA399_16215, partial [Desulfovibrionales bacterium]